MVIINNNVSETMSHLEDVSEISDSVDESEEGEIRSDSEHESYFTVKATPVSKAIRVVSDELCTDLRSTFGDSIGAVCEVNSSPRLKACDVSGAKSFNGIQEDVNGIHKTKRNTSKASTMRKEEDSEDELELRYIALRSAYLRGMQEVNQVTTNLVGEEGSNASPDKENSPMENNHSAEKNSEKELFLKTRSINKNFDPKDPRNACSLASEILKQIEKSQKIAHKAGSTGISSRNRKRSRKKSLDNSENIRKRSKVMRPDHRKEGSLPEPSKTDESVMSSRACHTTSNYVDLTDNISKIDPLLAQSLNSCPLPQVKNDGGPEYIVLDETDEDVEIIHESVILKQPMSPDYIRLDEPMDTQSESGSDLLGLDEDHACKIINSETPLTMEQPSFDGNQDEDEDEELLRANLLMDIAQKQREKEKLSDAVIPELEQPEKDRSPASDTSVNGQFSKIPYSDKFSSKKSDANKASILNVQELARKMLTNSRVIINLNESDDTSSTDEECCNSDIRTESVSAVSLPNGMESQVDLLLKSARNAVSSVAKKVVPKPIIATPKAICHLPVSKQREYRVLKQKLKERQLTKNNSVKRGVTSTSECLTNQGTLSLEPDEVANEEALQQDVSDQLEEKHNSATDIADFTYVDNTDILQLSDKVLQDCNSLIVNIKNQQEKSPLMNEGASEMDRKTRKDRLLQSLNSMEMRVLKQRDAVHVSLSNISDLLGVVAKTETEVKVLSNRQKELLKELSDLEMSLNGKKSFITCTNLEIKNAFVKVQKQKSMLQTNENKCIKYGKILRGANYNLPRKVVGKSVVAPTVVAKHGRKGPVHRRVALRSKINNQKRNLSVSTDVSKRRVVLKQCTPAESGSNQPSEIVATGQDYVSPLDHLRNKCPANMNPNQVLCHFELMGHCNDDSCEYQHHNRQGQSSRKHNPL